MRTRPVLYLTDIALGAILEPSQLYKGIILKAIVVVTLVQAVKAGYEYASYVRARNLEAAKDAFS